MPRRTRKSFRRTFRRQGRRMRRRFTRRSTYRPHGSTGWPAQRVVKLRCSHYKELAINTGDAVATVVRANSTYEPFPGEAVQPLGQDQWATFYDKYFVLKSTIHIKWLPAIYANGEPLLPALAPVVVLALADDSSMPITNDIYRWMANGTSVWRQTPSDAGAPNNNLSLRYTYNAKKWHNVKDVKDADTLEGNFDDPENEPTDITNFVILAGTQTEQSPTPNTITLHFVVNVTYTILLRDPKVLPISVQ